jgi:methionyl aminopeptidase
MKKIRVKNAKEIETMKEGGRRLKKVVKKLLPEVKEGISTDKINQAAEKFIKELGGYPSFKKIKGYHWATCLSINNQIVHTPPSERVLRKGDILTVDMGMYYQGYHTDWATTIIVGEGKNPQVKRFLDVGKRTLFKAIEQLKIGNYIGHISQAIENNILKNGYFVIKQLTGHGIGRDLHEEPYVPCFLNETIEKTPKIIEGAVLAIEIIYSQKETSIRCEKGNKWSLVTENGSLAACFEKTVALSKNNPLILT